MALQIQTMEQMRATHAMKRIKDVADTEKAWQSRCKSYVKALPAEILTEGLGQALATHLAAAENGRDPHRFLYDAVSDWLCRSSPYAPYQGESDILLAITRHGASAYRAAQREAMSYLVWLKKFAVAFLSDVEGAE
ncbi:MAG: type III-B CRISPR module-associated protein Cmr5 [Sulfobacillus thermosulfidooxidans]|nr:MAG: type III-B CRISPR module-associated protein Cmr5 [Sulfobacillus thermosulfidooxidans]